MNGTRGLSCAGGFGAGISTTKGSKGVVYVDVDADA